MAQTDPTPVDQPQPDPTPAETGAQDDPWGIAQGVRAAVALAVPRPELRAAPADLWLWALGFAAGQAATFDQARLVDLMEATPSRGGLQIPRSTAYRRIGLMRDEYGLWLPAGGGRILVPAPPAVCVPRVGHNPPHVHTHESARISTSHIDTHMVRTNRSPTGARAGVATVGECLGEYGAAVGERLADVAAADQAVDRWVRQITSRLDLMGERRTHPMCVVRIAQAAVDAGEWGIRTLREALRATEQAHAAGQIRGSPGAYLRGTLHKMGLHVPRGPPRAAT